ncbi:MAG: adenylate kinase family protein [archaeon GB-1867-005]|nr:adenylate kinase family protein [Candidatus Culexmicrobium cathedralense]
MMKKVIVIQGSPGTGKSTVAKKLTSVLNATHIDISRLIEDEKLYVGIDERRSGAKIADKRRLLKKLVEIIESSDRDVVVEGHFADIVPRKLIKCAIVLRVDPRELEKRLIKRKWPIKKVRENVLAEVLDECLIRAIQAYGEDMVREIDATGKNSDEIVNEILKAISDGDQYKPGRINWIKKLSDEGILDDFLRTYSALETEKR